MIHDGFIDEFKDDLLRFIDDIIISLPIIDGRWISLRVHLYSIPHSNMKSIIHTLYSSMHSKKKQILAEQHEFFTDKVVFTIDHIQTDFEFPLLEVWDSVKNDRYNRSMLWKWIKKINERLEMYHGSINGT